MPPVEGQLEAFQHAAFAHVRDGPLAAVEGLRDLLVAPVRPVRIDLQQNARPARFLAAALELLDDLLTGLAFGLREAHNGLLHGSFSLAVARRLGSRGPHLGTHCTGNVAIDRTLGTGEKRPDVFSAKYQRYVSAEVAKRVAPNQDNPWILGYYYGYGSFMREDLWINQTPAYPAGSPGRERLFDVLEQRYRGDTAQLNAVHRTGFASFSELRQHGSLTFPRWISAVKAGQPLPARAGAHDILADAEALLEEIVHQLHQVAHTEIRKHDANHLVLGSYVKHTTYTPRIWTRIAPYIDALGPQDISDVNPIKPSVAVTGIPALLSDQEFGNVYRLALQGKSGAPGAVPDHVDRRVLYDLLAGRIARDPDFIGVSFCAVLYDQ